MSRKSKKFAAKAPVSAFLSEPIRPNPLLREISTVDGNFGASLGKLLRTANSYNPDTLVGRHGLKVYQEMRTVEEQLKATLYTKKYSAISSGWYIEPPIYKGNGRKAQELTEFVEFNLGEFEGTLENALLNIMTALDFGYSVTEVVYKLIDYGPFKGKFGLRYLHTRKPEFIELYTDAHGNILPNGVVQNGIELPKDAFLIYSYNEEFTNPYGQSDLRAAYRPYFIKDIMLKAMSVALERYAEPIAIARTSKTLDPELRLRLETIFQNLQSRTLILIPDWIELTIVQASPHVADSFIPVLNKLDTWMRIAVMVPGLLGMSAEVGVGSFARSETEFDVFLGNIEQMRSDIAAKINDRFIKPLIDYNYDVDDGKYPKFVFRKINREELRKTFELLAKGTETGLITKTPATENIARELIEIPEIDESASQPMITKIAADAQAKAVEISATRTQQAGTKPAVNKPVAKKP
jgi:phage gp29-like protein